MRAALRPARSGSLLALPVFLVGAAGRHPTAMAAALFCARASVSRLVRADRAGTLGGTVHADGTLAAPGRPPGLRPWLRRALGAGLTAAPRASGWGRTRWRGATRAATRQAKHGSEVSAATVRRWRQAMAWVWHRAQRVAQDDDPHRVARVARLRCPDAHGQAQAVMGCAEALDRPLRPKVGAAWRPQGTPEEGMPPGQTEQDSLAGARPRATGQRGHGLGPRNNPGVFRALWMRLAPTDPAPWVTR